MPDYVDIVGDEDEDHAATTLTAAQLELPWEEFVPHIFIPGVGAASTRRRVSVLKGLAKKISSEDFADALLPAIVQHLLLTVPRFEDTASRKAVYAVLQALFEKAQAKTGQPLDAPFMKGTAKLLERELKGNISTMAPSILYNYASWTARLIRFSLSSSSAFKPDLSTYSGSYVWKTLLGLHVTLLDASATSDGCRSKAMFGRTVIATEKAVRSAGAEGIDLILGTLLTPSVVDGKEGTKICVLLGNCLNVAIKSNYLDVVNKYKNAIITFYTKAILPSRAAVPVPYLTSLSTCFQHYFTPDVFQKEIVAAGERLLLRSPEVVIRVLDHTARHVQFDLSSIFRAKFADTLFNNMKSTNESVRSDAANFFQTLCSKSADEGELAKVVDVAMKAFGSKAPSAEQRQMYYTALSHIPALPAVSRKLIESAPALSTKESNETSLHVLFQALAPHVHGYLTSPSPDVKVVTSLLQYLTSGVSDAKSGTRRAFLGLLANAVKGSALVALHDGLSKLVDAIIKIVGKVQAAGVALLDPKKETPALVEGYYGVGWLQEVVQWERAQKKVVVGADLEKTSFFANLLTSPPQKSFVLNDKYYTKLLPTVDEQRQFIRVVIAIVENDEWFNMAGASDSTKNQLSLAAALSWGLVQSAHHQIRRETYAAVSRMVKTNNVGLLQRLVRLVRLGLGNVITVTGAKERNPLGWNDKLSRSSEKFGHRAFGALCAVLPSASEEEEHPVEWRQAVEKSLMDLAVLTCHSSITEVLGEDIWIRLCFRAALGPHIVDEYGGVYIKKWLTQEQGDDVGEGGLGALVPDTIREATLSALVLFTDVATEAVVREAIPWCLSIMDNDNVKQVTPTDVDIWATPEGTLFHDPTVKKGAGRADDRPRTAEEKWERELRKELEKKGKGGAKSEKLSKADRELQQQQLEKESQIRRRVGIIRREVLTGLDVLDAVIDGVRKSVGEEAREAFGQSVGDVVRVLLGEVITRELVVAGKTSNGSLGPVLAGKRAINTFANLGVVVGNRLDGLVEPPTLAMAILRAIGVIEGEEGVEQRFCKRNVADFSANVLGSLKELYSVSDLFEPPTFAYLFPLLRAIVLRQGRIGTLNERAVTDLVMTASDVLLAHCGLASISVVPRREMLRCLLEMLGRYPRLRGAGREGLLILAFAVGAGDHDEDADENGETTNGDSAQTDVEAVVRELLDGLLSSEEAVRESCLMALSHLPVPSGISDLFDVRVWVAKFDEIEEIRKHADALWDEWNGDSTIEFEGVARLVELAVYKVEAVRTSAGRALSGALKEYPDAVTATMEDLYRTYTEKVAIPEPEYDDYGMVIPESLNKPDEWEARAGVAYALQSCVPVITDLEPIQKLFHFLIEGEGLGDRNERVQRLMLDAGLAAANAGGKTHVRELLEVIDSYLSKPAMASETHDRIRESCVILLGTLAQHLEPTDPLIPEVIAKLMDTLKTPSETVQVAVSECLPALVKVNKQGAQKLVEQLLHQLYTSQKYGERRGAAYGLAGVVKGCGISSLKDYQIMSSLKEAVEDKKRVEKREGALFAFETLSQTLGRLFEPYVIQILPLLLVCFGDNSREVREATEDACRVIMSKLSAHCVKLVLPSLLNGLEDKNWRTKTGSIDVLASMAFLAPKQLSVSLPTVVPRLCDVLADSHAKVQESAKQALNQFGNVIKNPEIQALVPVLLAALVDPNGKTSAALSALLDTAFVHYIDAPSLALLVPILHRGLKERGTDIKKKAAQIMGNMASLTDPKDLVPYLPTLMPGLKEVLVDPVPEARATAAKAFGNMVAKLGEDNFPGLVGELLDTLKSDTSGVDRSGAAQGLSEVISGLGLERLEGLLPEVVANSDSPKAYIREGFMTLLVYLPATHGEKFQPYLGTIIPSVLRGLADESEPVRDASMKTGQMIVRNYATKAVDLLLPELERGLFDENWRIRQSSVQLMGDLLYRIAGVSGKVELETPEDEGLGTEHGRQALVHALGKERFDKVLASLYVARADTSAIVRQASLHVWKSIVSNTPRTLKEILPIMMDILVASLASENVDKRGSAARCLGDLVRKLGESILSELLPILEKGLDSDREEIRQGVCVAMTEIMASAGKTQVVEFVGDCVGLVRKALVDEEPEVRAAAAQAFDMLHQHMGKQAIDEVLPSLLNMLKAGPETDRSSTYALEALKEIMAVRSNVVFPVLIPTLIARPISSFNAHALASLITVAGPALNKRLGTILPALMDAVEGSEDAVEDVRETMNVLLVNVDEEGVHQLMMLLTNVINEGSPGRKRVGCECLKLFCDGNREVLDAEYIGDWIELLVAMLRGGKKGEEDLVKSAWAALDSVIKRLKKEEMDRFVQVVRRAVRDAEDGLDEGEVLEGFSLPKGISPVLPIFLQGLMYGSPDNREQSALGLGDLVRRTSADALKPFVTQITGPLIRVIGDRFPPGVKSAILMTLGQLLDKVSAMLKPFLPQLQRTFVKCLSEPSSGMVRDRAARCLTSLIALQTRLDPLVAELAQGVRGAEDRGVRVAMWEALYGVVKGVGGPGRDLNAASSKTIEGLIAEGISMSGEHDDGIREGAAKVFGAYCRYVPKEESRALVTSQILGTGSDAPWYRLAGALQSLSWVMTDAPELIHQLELTDEAVQLVLIGLSNDKPQVMEEAVKAAGRMLSIQEYVAEGSADKLLPALVGVLPAGQASNDARREVEVVIKNVAKQSHQVVAPYLSTIVPALMLCVRDRNIPVKLAAERALLHVFEIGKETDVLQRYLGTLDAPTARNIGDYARRVLSKLVEKDSDDEGVVY
ncbi:hypothetical protein SpCBS45565_g04973 [Spizellomyces sp. 'palustris']|nr:hypothetical protein SpCBS45565_g04973 [Spizellomyces sp. 'palustris']